MSGKLWSRQVLPVTLTRPALAGLLFHKGKEYGDIPTQRAMIKRAFPRLTLAPARSYGDRSPVRFQWDGPADAASAAGSGS